MNRYFNAVLTATIVSSIYLGVSSKVFSEDLNIDKAVANAARSEADRKLDPLRKPAEILEFAGVRQGMTVIDLNAAGGYYSELISHVVGKKGKVYVHNGAVYWSYIKETVPQRFEGRLHNAVHLHTGQEELTTVPAMSLDVAFQALGYHDYWMEHAARPQSEDINAINKSIYDALKPGGVYVIIDHVGAEGDDAAKRGTLHRIQPSVVKAQMEAVGFKLAAEGKMLANAEDDPNLMPFRQGFRFNTDRFVYKFIKE